MQKLRARLSRRSSTRSNGDSDLPPENTPEGNVARGVKQFCESAGPDHPDDEVLHLPVIVEGAESSPAAAKEAALQIRQFLSKENFGRPHVQYNAVMLVRILADHPGRTFTRSLDTKFVSTIKQLLRETREQSVQQMVRETLETFAREKEADEGLAPLLEMWQKEKAKELKIFHNTPPQRGAYAQTAPGGPSNGAPQDPSQQQNYFARTHRTHRSLPPVHELVSRIEEAKTSAKLLLQVVQSTPSNEVLDNDLINEFAQRCQSASRSIQSYINAQNPGPDDDTLLTLIETNDQLSLAMSKHQRAVLQARKALAPQPGQQKTPSPPAAAPRDSRQEQNPFNDPTHQQRQPQTYPDTQSQPLIDYESFPSNTHPPPPQSQTTYPEHDRIDTHPNAYASHRSHNSESENMYDLDSPVSAQHQPQHQYYEETRNPYVQTQSHEPSMSGAAGAVDLGHRDPKNPVDIR